MKYMIYELFVSKPDTAFWQHIEGKENNKVQILNSFPQNSQRKIKRKRFGAANSLSWEQNHRSGIFKCSRCSPNLYYSPCYYITQFNCIKNHEKIKKGQSRFHQELLNIINQHIFVQNPKNLPFKFFLSKKKKHFFSMQVCNKFCSPG